MGEAIVLIVKVHVFALFGTWAEDALTVLIVIMSDVVFQTDFVETVPIAVCVEVVVETAAAVVATLVVEVVGDVLSTVSLTK